MDFYRKYNPSHLLFTQPEHSLWAIRCPSGHSQDTNDSQLNPIQRILSETASPFRNVRRRTQNITSADFSIPAPPQCKHCNIHGACLLKNETARARPNLLTSRCPSASYCFDHIAATLRDLGHCRSPAELTASCACVGGQNTS